jgi:2-hydroxyacyl-CoA lyase 1
LILGTFEVERQKISPIVEAPQSTAPQSKIKQVAEVIKSAKAPLVVIGKGAAYARAEQQIKTLVDG